MKNLILFSVVCLSLCLYSCKDDEPPVVDSCSDVRTYTNDIKTILDANCATSGCHDSATSVSDINLSDYSNAQSEAEMSRFLSAIRHETGFTAMPIGSDKLSDALITEIECWVQQGRPE